MSKGNRMRTRLLLFCGIWILGVFGCYKGWQEIEYEEACNPLDPETKCGLHQRCLPQVGMDPRCEGPVSLNADESRQDESCLINEDCGVREICMKIDDQVLSKICMQFCRESVECPEDYTCSKVGEHQMEVRGEEWGVCYKIAPPEWTCNEGYYAGIVNGRDNQCDCGCGAFDPDCIDDDEASCEMCNVGGNRQKCAPEAWDCEKIQYGDGNCDCGCGTVDPDCEDLKKESCYDCPAKSCGFGDCDALVLPNDNTMCKTPVAETGWSCGIESYYDGTHCECGCGVTDPDCEGPQNTYCSERCLTGSCAQDATDCSQGLFVASDNSQCVSAD